MEQEQYLGPLTVEAGIRVLLHGQGEMVFPFEEGFSVSPGMSTSVGIKKVRKNAFCLDLLRCVVVSFLTAFLLSALTQISFPLI